MISCFNNIHSPKVISEIDVYTFLDQISEPDSNTLSKILRARICNDDAYSEIKASLPCYTLNFSFSGRKSNNTIKSPTGFIYLDIDDENNVDCSNPLIFAGWKSLSGSGFGLLVKVDGLTLENFKYTYHSIGKELNIIVDPNAAKPTQYTVHSYDKDVYLNNESHIWTACDYTPNSLVTNKKKRRVSNDLGEKEPLCYDNIQEIDFEGKDFLAYPDEKKLIASLYIPSKIYKGSRNEYLYKLGYQLRALNPGISSNRFAALVRGINNSRCEDPLNDGEINRLIKNILELEETSPLMNVPRRIIFNPKSLLSQSAKRSIINRLTGQIRSKNTLEELKMIVKNWDVKLHGKITQNKLARVSGRNIKTIEKYFKDLLCI